MFFHRCSYKKGNFNELVCDFSVLMLMVYSYKDVLKNLAFDLVGSSSFKDLLCLACLLLFLLATLEVRY